ncbi:MAG: hypothetical protein J5795_07380 [Lachnospiraceae bacterium]|nr:hypothetical protein [Lachnospiraceae bacterium]
MKLTKRLVLLMFFLLMAFAVTACGKDDDDEKSSSKKSAPHDDPEELVDYYIDGTVEHARMEYELKENCMMIQNSTARKKLGFEKDFEEEEIVSWKIKKSYEYEEDDDVTRGVKAYIKGSGGDPENVQASALVDVSITGIVDGEEETMRFYFCVVKISGKWYITTENGVRASSIEDAEERWAAMAGRETD